MPTSLIIALVCCGLAIIVGVAWALSRPSKRPHASSVSPFTPYPTQRGESDHTFWMTSSSAWDDGGSSYSGDSSSDSGSSDCGGGSDSSGSCD